MVLRVCVCMYVGVYAVVSVAIALQNYYIHFCVDSFVSGSGFICMLRKFAMHKMWLLTV